MNEKAQQFVEAVQNDEYAEYAIGDNFVLITDWEGDGSFHPYVVLPHQYTDRSEVVDILLEEAGEFLTFSDVEIETQHLTFAHIIGAEIEVDK